MQFIDLSKQYQRIKLNIDRVVLDCISEANYIQGESVHRLEKELSDITNNFCVSCANGTDALYIALRALGVKSGDEVIVPSFTWVSTAEVVKLLDAKPVFVDIDSTYNLDINSLEMLITNKTKAIIAVSMFGRCPDLIKLQDLCNENKITLIEDAAQSFGAKFCSLPSCGIADISTTSFFPAKPLGCYGDGGAIFTKHPELYEKINAISKHGQRGRYNYVEIGVNSRLDTLQACILLEKLKIFDDEIYKKNQIAQIYNERLSAISGLIVPEIPDSESRSVWAQYTIQLPTMYEEKRSLIMDNLKTKGVPTALYYPAPIHRFEIYSPKRKVLPFTEKVCNRVLSLPMHAYLSEGEIDLITTSLIDELRIV